MSVSQALSTLGHLQSLHREQDQLARSIIGSPASAASYAGTLIQKLHEQDRLLDDMKRQIDDIQEAD